VVIRRPAAVDVLEAVGGVAEQQAGPNLSVWSTRSGHQVPPRHPREKPAMS
jgi:hypothetical protein